MCVGAIEPQFYKIFVEKLGFSSKKIPQFENFEENRRRNFQEKDRQNGALYLMAPMHALHLVLSLKNTASYNYNKQRQMFIIVGDNIIPNPAPRLSRTLGIVRGTYRSPQPVENTVEILNEN